MFMSRVRRYGFWTLDVLKGGEVRRHYQDIRSKMGENHVDINHVHQYQLKSLIEHAKKYTDFYKGVKGESINDFPVITKSDLKEKFDSFQSKFFGRIRYIHENTVCNNCVGNDQCFFGSSYY